MLTQSESRGEREALKSIENDVATLCKTLSTLDKNQRTTAAKVERLLRAKTKTPRERKPFV